MIVVDASVVYAAVCEDGPDGESARRRIAGEELAAPHVVDLEVVSAMRGRVRRGALSQARALAAIRDLDDFMIDRVSGHGQLARIWELRNNLSPYDAAYVVLAELLDVVFVTADARLATAPGIRCDVEVLATPA